MIVRSNAFTLIELLVVVAVIAILAAIAVPNFLEAQTRSKVSRVHADLRSQRVAIEAYAVDENTYPRMTWGGPPFNDLYEGNGSPLQPVWGTLGPALTTPIAYMTQYDLIDPFMTSPRIQADLRQYTYHDLKTRTFIASQPTTGPLLYTPSEAENEFFERNFGAYAQMSAGPDREAGPFYEQYDPTNGTVSAGNIWISQRHNSPVAIVP